MKYKATCPECSSQVVLAFTSTAERGEWMSRHAESTMHNPEVVEDA